jgi:hypothetical protein
MVVDAAQNTQYHKYNELPYGVEAELLRAKSELPIKPEQVMRRRQERKYCSGEHSEAASSRQQH